MAVNIQSGSTWAEIRAELNNKTFDKNGDTLLGSISDVNGNEAIKIDADKQKIISYGLSGESNYGEVVGVEAGDIVIPIPKGMKRGICAVLPHERTSYSSGDALMAMIHFSTNLEQSKIWGWRLDYDFREYDRILQMPGSNSVTAYIDGEELKISISSNVCEQGNLSIYWEVW